MIAFFPEIYPDELLYSQLARYHSRSGYARYVFTVADIYNKLAMPSNIAIGIIIAIVIDVICALYIAMTIIVGRNPQKFGKRFVRLFFKEGYLRY